MSRSRASAKQAGTKFETLVANYLRAVTGNDGIERRTLTGRYDRGDISGVKLHGQRVAIEVKNTARLDVAGFLAEAEAERVNDSALVGVVVAKRTGKGRPEDQLVIMTLADFAAILTGERPNVGGIQDAGDQEQKEN